MDPKTKAIRTAIMRRHPDVFLDEAEILRGPYDGAYAIAVMDLVATYANEAAKQIASSRYPRCGCGGAIVHHEALLGYKCLGCGKFVSEQQIKER
jgi:hypothetical protein